MDEGKVGKQNTAEQKMEKLISELKKYQREPTMLQGIVIVCSFCKRIRNDWGYWVQVDTSAAQYSKVKFSHSVCPECLDLHYHEFHNKK